MVMTSLKASVGQTGERRRLSPISEAPMHDTLSQRQDTVRHGLGELNQTIVRCLRNSGVTNLSDAPTADEIKASGDAVRTEFGLYLRLAADSDKVNQNVDDADKRVARCAKVLSRQRSGKTLLIGKTIAAAGTVAAVIGGIASLLSVAGSGTVIAVAGAATIIKARKTLNGLTRAYQHAVNADAQAVKDAIKQYADISLRMGHELVARKWAGAPADGTSAMDAAAIKRLLAESPGFGYSYRNASAGSSEGGVTRANKMDGGTANEIWSALRDGSQFCGMFFREGRFLLFFPYQGQIAFCMSHGTSSRDGHSGNAFVISEQNAKKIHEFILQNPRQAAKELNRGESFTVVIPKMGNRYEEREFMIE